MRFRINSRYNNKNYKYILNNVLTTIIEKRKKNINAKYSIY